MNQEWDFTWMIDDKITNKYTSVVIKVIKIISSQ